MVQFSERIAGNRIQKWARHYVDYTGLKKVINDRVAEREKRAAAVIRDRRIELASPSGPSGSNAGSSTPRDEKSRLLEAAAGAGAAGYASHLSLASSALGDEAAGATFLALVKAEVDKVEDFFCKKRDKVTAQLDAQLAFERDESARGNAGLDASGGGGGGAGQIQMHVAADPRRPPKVPLRLWDEESGGGDGNGGNYGGGGGGNGNGGGGRDLSRDGSRDSGATTPMGRQSNAGSGSDSDKSEARYPAGHRYSTGSAGGYGAGNGTPTVRRPPTAGRRRCRRADATPPGTPPTLHSRRPEKSAQHSLRRGFLEVYRSLTLLDNFGVLNYTAIIKIAKKHDKKLSNVPMESLYSVDSASGSFDEGNSLNSKDAAEAIFYEMSRETPICAAVNEYLTKQDFSTRKKLSKEMQRCELEFAIAFCGGDIAQARGMLLPPKTDESVDLAQFQLGYRMGMAALLAIWLVWDCIEESWGEDRTYTVIGQPAFKAYRAIGGILLLQWCWGTSVWVWTRTRINYLYLFGLSMRNSQTPLEIFNSAALQTILFFFNLLLYYKTVTGKFLEVFPAGAYPLAMCMYALGRCFFPWERRWDMVQTMLKVALAPAFRVDFLSTYVGDVFTSSVKTLLDTAWTACFFLSGDFLLSPADYAVRGNRWWESWAMRRVVVPLLCVWPLELRLLQCLRRHCDTHKRVPHLLNALKYIMAAVVALFGVFQSDTPTMGPQKVIWIVLYVASSLYSFFWDVSFDWGQEVFSKGRLTERRMFSRRWMYWTAIWADLVLRFNWLYSFIPPGLTFGLLPATLPLYLTTFVLAAEMLRRTMWGFFRLEHEHVRNTEGYRAVTDVVPLHFTTEIEAYAGSGSRRPAAAIVGEVIGVGVAAVLVCLIAVIVAVAEPGG